MPEATVSDLLTRPATELAKLVHDGEVTARELTEASLARIEATNDRVNAFIDVDAEGALAAADAIGPGDPRPFAGVPMGIKTELAAKGLLMTRSSELFGDYRPETDANSIGKLREAGFVFVGATNMPEFGIMPVTEPHRFGATRNPWDLDRTPGGSSGGSGAAVAAGMVPIAAAGDGGGSIRIPASCCGLVGLKAARNRISLGPDIGDHWLVNEGVLTRTVDETAQVLDLLSGYVPGDANWAPPPMEPFAMQAAREPGRKRIALVTDSPVDAPVDPAYVEAAQEAGKLLESLGHEVVETSAEWRADQAGPMFLAAFGTAISTAMLQGASVTGREVSPDLVEPLSWAIWEQSQGISGVGYNAIVALLSQFAREVISFVLEYDAVLTPALGQRPVPIGTYDMNKADVTEWGRTGEFTPFTAIANITGLPAIALPLFHGDDGLPTAVHMLGRPADEGTLLSLGNQLEQARPWADRIASLD